MIERVDVGTWGDDNGNAGTSGFGAWMGYTYSTKPFDRNLANHERTGTNSVLHADGAKTQCAFRAPNGASYDMDLVRPDMDRV